MKVEKLVSKIKFEQQVDILSAQAETLKGWGVVIGEIAFPTVRAIFIPKSYLNVSITIQHISGNPLPPGVPPIPPELKAPPGKPIKFFQTRKVPCLAARAFGAIISLDDFDQRAPSVVFCDPFTWKEIPYAELFRGNHIGEEGKSFNVLLENHPLTKKPFLCMRGIREYHEHPQHTGDDWMQYRKHCSLFSTIQTIWKTCVLNAKPNMIFEPTQLKVIWEPSGGVIL